MGRSWNFIFNSTKGQGQMTDFTTDSHTVTFPLVEWDRVLPQGKFKLTWTYSGSGNMLTARDNTYVQLIGLSHNNYETTTEGAKTTVNLGILKQKGGNLYQAKSNTNFNVGYLDGNLDDNSPIYLNSRPSNGQLVINLRTQYNKKWLDDVGSQVSSGIVKKGNNTDFGTMESVPSRARYFIGSILWWQSAGFNRYAKVLNFTDWRGQPITPPTFFNLTSSAFGTSGITLEIENAESDRLYGGGQNPGHYILTLNFELIE